MAAAAMAPPPTSARLCPPRLTTTMTWQPPSVEDTVDEGEEENQETPCAKDLLSPATLAALATPATSVTSFESDTPDEREDNLPPRRHSSAISRAASRSPSYRSNISAPLARRASSHQAEHPFLRDDDASTRVIPEARTDDDSRDRQVGGSAMKSQNNGLQLPPSPAFHSTVSRITPAALSSIFPPNTASLSINTSPTATSPLCLSPSMSAADMPSPLSPSDRPKVRFRDRGPPVIHSQARPTGPRPLSSEHQGAPNAAPQQQQQGWGILFDEGYSTPRLGHVLRGLAALVISRFGSAGDVVVTPKAMRGMYTKYTLGNDEVWHYHAIFDQSCLSDIGALYRDMECRHHLVQESPRSRPNVPGLTVDGWATWIAANILAYPDQEHHRLNKMVADLSPLTIPDGPDGELLTLPTTLPRHCFPATSDRKTRAELGKAIDYVLRDGEEAYVTSRPSRESRYNQGFSSRPGPYTYQADSRVSRYSVPRSNTDIRTTSMSRSYPFDSRIRTRTPVPDNRNAVSSPNIGRSMTSATTTPRDSRRRSRRNDNPTYEDYFQAACRHSREIDSSPERPPRSRRHSDDRGERRRRD
ncbi:hypothetical protein F5X68DRAFT_80908 [Plectosphaerella plurivora]|uniref:DUF7514 domain-containing protein n=1 Tax=Plectosphaerella plurivora TaxID=936078 RepID=A0A9P9A9D2_9PEZI|nr:hypothetical protein F5X68DRAFT_80908 [Plectosphaerella plurivora]